VDLLISTVHRINACAETKVVGDFVAELKRMSGKGVHASPAWTITRSTGPPRGTVA
jgi:hypothetical protein